MDLKEISKRLSGLYRATEMDWTFSIHHILTEPMCPSVCIQPEGSGLTRYAAMCDRDQVEATVERLVNLVHTEIVEGRLFPRFGLPFTNPCDRVFDEWLQRRSTNAEEPFPIEEFLSHCKEN